MKKTILFRASGRGDSNYTLSILSSEFDLKNQTGYVKIDDNKKMFTKIYNLVLNATGAKEHSIDKLTNEKEDLLYGSEVGHDLTVPIIFLEKPYIIVPIIFLEKPFMVYGEVIKLKEKHIVKEHVPTKFVVTDKNPNTINVNDENIIVINYDFVSGKELSFIEGREVCETGKDFETNCLDFFSPHLLDIYCDVVVVKKDKSYISLKDLLANNDERYTSQHMREAHNTQKMLKANSFNFKQAVDLFIKDEKCLFILHHHPLTLADVKNTIVKVNNTNTDMSKFIINSVRNDSSKIFSYSCNTNIYLSRKLLNKRLDYDDVNIIFTKEDVEKI